MYRRETDSGEIPVQESLSSTASSPGQRILLFTFGFGILAVGTSGDQNLYSKAVFQINVGFVEAAIQQIWKKTCLLKSTESPSERKGSRTGQKFIRFLKLSDMAEVHFLFLGES